MGFLWLPPKCCPLLHRLCAGCQSLFPGVSLPPQRRCRWLCPDCRGELRPQCPPPHPLHAPPRSLSPSPTFLSSLRAFSVLFSSSFSFYSCLSFPGVFPLHHHHHRSLNCSNPVIIILFLWNFLFLLLFPDSSLPPFPSLLDHCGGEGSLKKFGSGVRGDPRKAGVTLTPLPPPPPAQRRDFNREQRFYKVPQSLRGGNGAPGRSPDPSGGLGGLPRALTPSPHSGWAAARARPVASPRTAGSAAPAPATRPGAPPGPAGPPSASCAAACASSRRYRHPFVTVTPQCHPNPPSPCVTVTSLSFLLSGDACGAGR